MADDEQHGVTASGDASVEVAPIYEVDRDADHTEAVQPRLRLGQQIRLARANVGAKLEDVAGVLGISIEHLMSVENGNMTLPVSKLQQIAQMTGCDLDGLISASRDFSSNLFSENAKAVGAEMVGGAARMISMPPEQVYVEFREGWFAGASGRPDPGDMSPSWMDGHEGGRLSMETAFHGKRLELGIHYGDSERGEQRG